MKELEEYKKRVLALAEKIRDEQGWCREGMVEALKKIDIDLTEKWKSLPIGSVVKSPDNDEVMIKLKNEWMRLEYTNRYTTDELAAEIADLDDWTIYQPVKEG